MVRRLLYWMILHPVLVLTLTGLITVGLGWAALSLSFSADLQGMLPGDDPSVVDFVEMSRSYGSQDYLLVAVHHPDGVFNPGTLQKVWTLTQALQALPERWVEDVRSILNAEIVEGRNGALVVRPAAESLPQTPEDIAAFRATIEKERLLSRLLLSSDRNTTLIVLEERPQIINSDEAMRMSEAVEALVMPFAGPEQIYLSGGPYIISSVRNAMIRDLRLLIPIALVVLLGVLLVSFRQWRGMLLPVAVSGLTVVWTLGFMALVGFKLTIVSVVIPVILIALANADSIHILTRYQEALHHTPSKRRALYRALRSLGQPVVYTSLSSSVGFLGVATAYSVIVREFGLATALGIVFALVLSLTFLPALLAVLPARSATHLTRRRTSRWVLGWRLGSRQQSRRWLRLAIVVFVVGLLGVGRIQINNNPLDYVRQDLPVVQSARFVQDTFGGSLTLRLVLGGGKPDRWKDPQWLARVAALQAYVESLPHTGPSTSLVDVVREINTTLHDDDPAYDVIPNDIRAVAQSLLLFEFGGGASLDGLVKRDYSEGQATVLVESLPLGELTTLVDAVDGYLKLHFPDAVHHITGQPIFGLRLGQTLIPSQASSLAISLFLVWGMLLLLTRSLRLSLISIVPLVISVAVMLGAMGYLGINLDIGTVMVASVAIGIGVDFAIHFIAQYQQARRRLAPEPAITQALALTWRALWYHTLSLSLGFSVMLLSHFTANIAFGGLMGLTVAVAFVSSLRLVPALLLLTSKVSSFRGVRLFKELYSLVK